jgi:hypothetical protein
MPFDISIYILKALVEVPGRETSKLPRRLKWNENIKQTKGSIVSFSKIPQGFAN